MHTASQQSMNPRRQHSCLSQLAETIAIAALHLSWLRGYTDQVDIHPADELVYLWMLPDAIRQGVWPDIAWCPIYSLAYQALALLPTSGHLPDVMFAVVSTAAPLALWWSIRPVAGGLLAMLAAVWLSASPTMVPTGSIGLPLICGIYAFATALTLAGVGCFVRGRHVAGFLLLASAAATRSEYAPWLACIGAWTSWRTLTGQDTRRRGLILLISVMPLVIAVASADFHARSWMAFRQHYGQRAQRDAFEREWQERQGMIPEARIQEDPRELQASFDQPDRWVERDFPGAHDVLSAIRVNRARALWHMSSIATSMPDAVATTLSTWWDPFVTRRWWFWALVALATAGWLGAAASSGRRSPRMPPGLAPLLLLTPLTLLGPLAVGARAEFTLPFSCSLLAAIAIGVRRLASIPAWSDRAISHPNASLIAGALLLASAWITTGPFPSPARALPNRDGIQLLRESLPPGNTRLLTTQPEMPFRLLQRPDLHLVRPTSAGEPDLRAMIDRQNIDAVLCTPDLLRSLRMAEDALIEGLRGWELRGPRGDTRLFVKKLP